MEKDNHDLRVQEKKAEEELLKLSESDRSVLGPVLDLQKQRTAKFLDFISELQALQFKYDALYLPMYTQRFELSKSCSEFWLKCMRNNSVISPLIFDQDFELLRHLVDIRHISQVNSDNFTLEFHFSENPVIQNTVLYKKYVVGVNDNPIKGEGTEIQWKKASLTQKTKKTKKRGKNKKVETKVEEIPSFFLFFKTISDDMEDENPEDEFGDPLEDDYETACEFRDELIPNAAYYYLGVGDEESESESEEGEKTKAKKVDAAGTEKAECKPQ